MPILLKGLSKFKGEEICLGLTIELVLDQVVHEGLLDPAQGFRQELNLIHTDLGRGIQVIKEELVKQIVAPGMIRVPDLCPLTCEELEVLGKDLRIDLLVA